MTYIESVLLATQHDPADFTEFAAGLLRYHWLQGVLNRKARNAALLRDQAEDGKINAILKLQRRLEANTREPKELIQHATPTRRLRLDIESTVSESIERQRRLLQQGYLGAHEESDDC